MIFVGEYLDTTLLNGQRGKQVRNQLATPGAAKSFLRGDHIF